MQSSCTDGEESADGLLRNQPPSQASTNIATTLNYIMPIEDFSKTWHEALSDILTNCKAKLSALDIPIIEGTLRGSGHTLIYSDFSYLEKHEALLRQKDCLGVIDIEYSDEEKTDRLIRTLAVHVRLGNSNSWLSADISRTLIGDDGEEDNDLDEEMEPAVDSSALMVAALATARTPQFGSLKNKGQRQDLVLSILKKNKFKDVPSYYAAEIAQRAESIYEFGVLPEQVRNLSAQGKTISEISKELQLTRQKAERALSAETPEFIVDMMKTAQQSSQLITPLPSGPPGDA